MAALEPTDGYSVVGLATADDGTIYLLERKLVLATWFRSRLSQVAADWNRVVLWESDHGGFRQPRGRFGLGSAGGAAGGDGFRQQRACEHIPTEIVEIRLTE